MRINSLRHLEKGDEMKTPEEMAEEYLDKNYQLDPHFPANVQGDKLPDRQAARPAFLAGYNAGYAAGFEGAMKMQEAVIEHLEKQMVEEMYVRMEPLLKEEK